MKIKIVKKETETGEMPDAENPKEDNPVKTKRVKIKSGNQIKSQYGTYSGIVNNEGKNVDKPTEVEAIKNMAQYMKNNQSDQSDTPSNVYRPKFSHLAINYKKKNSNNA